MGFGVANILNKYARPALISWDDWEYVEENGFYGLVEKGSINVDVRISETHKYQNNVVTQTMEDGSVIDEHVINKPVELSLQFEETNNTALANGLLGSVSIQNQIGQFSPWLKSKLGGPVSTFEKLTQLAVRKVPLTITTQHAIYTDMVIKNMPIIHSAPYRGRLQVAFDVVQLNFSKTKTFTYSAKEKGTQKAASENVNSGQQVTLPFSI